jgi:hypothetical protein
VKLILSEKTKERYKNGATNPLTSKTFFGDRNGMFGKKHSEESKRKMGVNKGRVFSEEVRKRMSEAQQNVWNKGRTNCYTEATLQKMRSKRGARVKREREFKEFLSKNENITFKEAIELFKMSTRTLSDMCKNGELYRVKNGVYALNPKMEVLI